MEIKKKKLESLSGLFLKYLVSFLVWNIIVFGLLICVSDVALSSGIVLPANYAEWAIKQVKDEIATAQEFDEALIPYTCEYVLIDNENQIIHTNVSEKKAEKIVKVAYEEYAFTLKQYQVIDRQNEKCILVYDVMMHFSNPLLHKICPKPELLSFSVFLMIAVLVAMRFAKRLRKELKPILDATKAIMQKELDFQVGITKIKEFYTVLQSVLDMKDALQESLKEQWTMEQQRKMQIAAITHDMKTPITIVRGNAELLQESELTTEQNESIESILLSVEKMENYLSLLMEATKSEGQEQLNKTIVVMEEFVGNLEKHAKAQCLTKSIFFQVETHYEKDFSGEFLADAILLERAIVNVIDNAVEYTPMHGTIKLLVEVAKETISFSVIDSGVGFSEESMKKATQQFYTENAERSGKHYGLGLFIAESVAKKHGGEIRLANSEGAVVAIIINFAKITEKSQ